MDWAEVVTRKIYKYWYLHQPKKSHFTTKKATATLAATFVMLSRLTPSSCSSSCTRTAKGSPAEGNCPAPKYVSYYVMSLGAGSIHGRGRAG